jgi:3-phosphoshikimate 1-carboxyvinyltransferase
MQHFGIVWSWNENVIRIENQEYKSETLFIESDWSGASYWYEIMALNNLEAIELLGLSKNSLQGDSKLIELFEKLGISTEFGENRAKLYKNKKKLNFFEYNFNEQPDIAQTFAVTLCILNIPFHFWGLETLKIKESNRIEALMNELAKLGFELNEPQNGELAWSGKKTKVAENQHIEIETYNDHRMALAFAPASILFENLIIKDAGVVSKSYPEFWEHIENVGFIIDEII